MSMGSGPAAFNTRHQRHPSIMPSITDWMIPSNKMVCFLLAILCIIIPSITTTTANAQITTEQTTTMVDLSMDWTQGPLYNKNKAHCMYKTRMYPQWTLGYAVIQKGLLVAEAYTQDNQANGINDAWSVTKSWSTFFIGILVDEGKLSITDTLADVFDQEADWAGVGEADSKKAVTIFEVLTMTSGLVTGVCQEASPQDSVAQVMNHVDYVPAQKGLFNYLGQAQLLAKIIERRAGMTTMEFLNNRGIFSALGMVEGVNFNWITSGGQQNSANGLQTNPRILAKLGQLYLQNGWASSTQQLVSESWVDTSTHNELPEGVTNPCESAKTHLFEGYGYQWYAPLDEIGEGTFAGAFQAIGKEGQHVVVLPATNTVIALMGVGFASSCENTEVLKYMIENLVHIDTEQTSCDESFSYWDYWSERGGWVNFLNAVRSSIP